MKTRIFLICVISILSISANGQITVNTIKPERTAGVISFNLSANGQDTVKLKRASGLFEEINKEEFFIRGLAMK